MVNHARVRVAVALAVLPVALLAGCKPAAGAGAASSARPDRTALPFASGKGGAGSLTLTVTKPVTLSGHVDTTVSCVTAGRTYTASADSAVVAGYRVAFAVRVTPYRGPATYPAAIVSLRLDGPTGTIASGEVPAPVTVTSSGGAFTLDTTTDTGKALSASVEWACS
jgi:hypothetical protein